MPVPKPIAMPIQLFDRSITEYMIRSSVAELLGILAEGRKMNGG